MRSDPDPTASEAILVAQYLDYQRETVLSKTDGLTQEQMTSTHPPSELTMAGLVYHLALVEEDWMEVRFRGLGQACERSRQVVAGASGLDQSCLRHTAVITSSVPDDQRPAGAR